MNTNTAPLSDRLDQARRMAREGYGIEDIIVHCAIDQPTARQFVSEAEYRRLSKVENSRP